MSEMHAEKNTIQKVFHWISNRIRDSDNDSTSRVFSSKNKISRRSFLKFLGGTVTYSGMYAMGVPMGKDQIVGDEESQSEFPSKKDIQETVRKIEEMSLSDQEHLLFTQYPVVPDISKIRDQLNDIATIKEGSIIMKVGTSAGSNIGESIWGKGVNPASIELGEEQYKLEAVLRHFMIPKNAFEAVTQIGVDADQLLHDPTFCTEDSPMPCPPNTSLVKAYVARFSPRLSINFLGTNMVRQKVELSAFAKSITDLIEYSISQRVIPVLTTFPHPRNATDTMYQQWFEEPVVILRPGQSEEEALHQDIEYRSSMLPENAFKYNVLLLKLAELYQIPIINTERGVVEQAELHGIRPASPMRNNEIDPEHFSRQDSPTALTVPKNGEKFQTGEEAVSYFLIQTLYEIIQNQER